MLDELLSAAGWTEANRPARDFDEFGGTPFHAARVCRLPTSPVISFHSPVYSENKVYCSN